MLVKELIKKLQEFNENLEVFYQDLDDGFQWFEMKDINEVSILKDKDDKYVKVEDIYDDKDKKTAVLIDAYWYPNKNNKSLKTISDIK